ncbi:polysaccharide biosynthesis/export family protein [Mangrovimonas cancribranchiae]|uniref:Polysaccharide biosynthesis/export family protein n=1 Tax=Mangrovimonas cancribranchiae TaxID=3080055 RepID=A0AAU6P2D2_9FLAO
MRQTRPFIILVTVLGLLTSCASKKDILYMQDAEAGTSKAISYTNPTIQPNDILKITVESTLPEAALPYNKVASNTMTQNLQIMQLDGYLVSKNNTITFPVLGTIATQGKTTATLAEAIREQLMEGNHLADPSVNVRLLNAKVSVLGEVKQPGTFTFTEQNITLMQALGYAGDLTINGKRDDIIVMRELDDEMQIAHINLTESSFIDSEFYYIKPNDVIVVNPNNTKVKTAGFIGNAGTVLTIASLALSVTILLTR